MTREEQIHNYAYNNCITEDADDNSYSLIVDAIKWADETMLEKACEWWKLRISVDMPIEINENGEPLANNWIDAQMERMKVTEEFISEFRKAMEE